MDSWYKHGLMVLKTQLVLFQIHGIVSVPVNLTHTRGLSVAPMRDFHHVIVIELQHNLFQIKKAKSLHKIYHESLVRSRSDLHDLSRDDRLQGVEVVGQVGQGVLGPHAAQPGVGRGG